MYELLSPTTAAMWQGVKNVAYTNQALSPF